MSFTVKSSDLAATEQIGRLIGSALRGREPIQLVSDLGGGKTSLVRGIAKGMGSVDPVASPSFTISREYHASKLIMFHYDFYRLDDPGIMASELAERLADPDAVVAIEWAGIVTDILPAEHIVITIESLSETERSITISGSSKFAYIIEPLKDIV